MGWEGLISSLWGFEIAEMKAGVWEVPISPHSLCGLAHTLALSTRPTRKQASLWGLAGLRAVVAGAPSRLGQGGCWVEATELRERVSLLVADGLCPGHLQEHRASVPVGKTGQ